MPDLNYANQRKILIICFLFIPIVLLCTFSFLPLVNMTYYSTLKWNGYSKHREFVGFANYIRLFSDPEYFAVFKVSLYYLVGSFIQLALALFFATMLSFKIKAKNFFKGVLFFPYLLNGVAIAFIFLFFFKHDGTLDSVMKIFRMDSFIQYWLRDIKWVNVSMVFTSIWRYIGFNFIIFLGAIQSIDSQIFEASDIDGANKWHKFIYIILPSIRNILELNLILSISGAISGFEIPYVMMHGANGTKTFVIQTVETAFTNGKLGLASAMAIVLLFIVITVTLLQKVYFKRTGGNEL